MQYQNNKQTQFIMKAIVKDKDTIYRLRMNKKTKTIKIDYYHLFIQSSIGKKIYEYLYMGTYHCLSIDKQDFEYYYNNNATFNDVRMLIRTADKSTVEYKPYYKFKY